MIGQVATRPDGGGVDHGNDRLVQRGQCAPDPPATPLLDPLGFGVAREPDFHLRHVAARTEGASASVSTSTAPSVSSRSSRLRRQSQPDRAFPWPNKIRCLSLANSEFAVIIHKVADSHRKRSRLQRLSFM
jgi:hypothetical protein